MSTKSLKPGWRMVKFGVVVKNANLVERNPETNGLQRIVGFEHIDPENLHIRRWNSIADGTSFTRKFVPGQTLFGKRRAYQRKVAYAEFEGICSGDILTFEPKNNKVLLPELLPFICQSDAFFDHALDTSAGSLSPRTSWTALKDFEFPLSPLDEQKRIAEILWAADEAVEKDRNVASCAEKVVSTFAFEYFAAALNLEMVELSKLTHFIRNGIVGKAADFYVPKNQGVSYLTSKNVRRNRLDAGEMVYVSRDFHAQKDKTQIRGGDVIIVQSGHIGEECVFPGEFGEANCHALIMVRPEKEKLLSDYLSFYLNSAPGIKSLSQYFFGSTIMHINTSDIRKLKIPYCDIGKQREFVNLMQGI